MPRSLFSNFLLATLVVTLFSVCESFAQSASPQPLRKSDKAVQEPSGQQEQDPLKRPIPEKQRKKNAKELQKGQSREERRWLKEDVAWIITDEEREAFKKLTTDEERDAFIEQFWLRRDPTPDTEENEYKEEHYRRITYANEHFTAGVPGWRTDRGRIYILHGAPDEIESHPSGGMYQRPTEEGGGTTSTYPFETWRYRYIDGVGQDVKLEFVDTCMCGDYHLSMDPDEKDALAKVPGAGPKISPPRDQDSRIIDSLPVFVGVMRPPKVKFKDLEEVVTHKINVNMMPFDVRADFLKVTGDTDLVPITIQIQNRDMTFTTKDGVATGTVNIFGRVSNITGRVVQTFEDTVERQVPSELLPKTLEIRSVYWKALPLRPGRYKLDLALKDVNGDRVGTLARSLVVPEFTDDKLTASSLILADQMEKVPTKVVNGAPFVIASTKVRPRVDSANGQPARFRRSEEVNLWMQVYNLSIDPQTKKPNAQFEYDVVNVGTNKTVVRLAETTAEMANPGEQVTLEKTLPLAGLQPGVYRVTITIKDQVANQTLAPTAKFAVQ